MAIPTLHVESASDTFDELGDWLEMAEASGAGESVATVTSASDTAVGLVPWRKERSAREHFLGYSWCDEGSPYGLYRHNPKRHPRNPNLRVRSVSFRPIVPLADESFPAVFRGTVVPFAEPASPAVGIYAAVATGDGSVSGFSFQRGLLYRYFGGVWSRFSGQTPLKQFTIRGDAVNPTTLRASDVATTYSTKYEWAVCTVQYGQWGAMDFIEDDDATWSVARHEWERNVTYDIDPQVEQLSLEGGIQPFLTFIEGSAATGAGLPGGAVGEGLTLTVGTEFKAPYGFLDVKGMDCLSWQMAPQNFVFDPNLVPTKIQAGLGKVNSVDWNGYPAGTALLLGAKFAPAEWPYYSETGLLIHWTVKFFIKTYDPQRGVVTPVDRGWNTFKWKDGFSYTARRGKSASSSSAKFHLTYDFAKLFEHWAKP